MLPVALSIIPSTCIHYYLILMSACFQRLCPWLPAFEATTTFPLHRHALLCRVYGPWLEGAVQQVEAGLNLTVVLTAEGQCFQMGETGGLWQSQVGGLQGARAGELLCCVVPCPCCHAHVVMGKLGMSLLSFSLPYRKGCTVLCHVVTCCSHSTPWPQLRRAMLGRAVKRLLCCAVPYCTVTPCATTRSMPTIDRWGQ